MLLGAAGILRSRPGGLAGSAAPVVLAVAVTSLLISVATHRYWGHGPASLEPMDNVRFILAHKAFVVAGAVALTGLVLVMYGRRYRPSAWRNPRKRGGDRNLQQRPGGR